MKLFKSVISCAALEHMQHYDSIQQNFWTCLRIHEKSQTSKT